jgi:hypothetical protein
MWFWLARRAAVPGIGFNPNRASRFFVATAGAAAVGIQALQLGVDRTLADLKTVLPADYALDTSQRFSAADATALAKRTGVQNLTMLTVERLNRLGALMSDQLQRSLRIPLANEVLPDAQLLDRVKAGMAAGSAPDLVIGDETLATQLQRLGYSTDFIRL